MKRRRVAVMFGLLTLLCHAGAMAQQAPQPIKYFGYSGVDNDAAALRVKSYTNFSYIGAAYGSSIMPQVTALRNNGLKAVIDLGSVLWCPDDPNSPYGGWHLCSALRMERNYTDRWNEWTSANASVLNSNNVLAFSVITEQTLRGISVEDVQTATSLVKQRYPDIATMVIDFADDVYYTRGTYRVPNNVDWVGVFRYYIHPAFPSIFTESVNVLKSKKQSWQRTVYVLDGFYKAEHAGVAPTSGDMDQVAQAWYLVASEDPEAILLGVFLWPDIPEELAIGSANLDPPVLNKHAEIGRAILEGRGPTYQGVHDYTDCRVIGGWARDASLPETPIMVDIYNGTQRLATVRADKYRADVGNHGFSYHIPVPLLKDGKPHTISVKFHDWFHDRTAHLLNGSPMTLTCPSR